MDKKKMIAVLRCETVSEICPGSGCLNAFNEKKSFFSQYDPNDLMIGFFTCGGCPGRRVPRLINKLLKHNLTTVHLSTCVIAKTEDSYKCPFWQDIKKLIESKGIEVIEGSH